MGQSRRGLEMLRLRQKWAKELSRSFRRKLTEWRTPCWQRRERRRGWRRTWSTSCRALATSSSSNFCPVLLCATLWYLVVPCGALWCLVVPCGALWCSVVPCGALWCLVVFCGTLWCLVVFCGTLWYLLVPFGTVWPCRLPLLKLRAATRRSSVQ